MSGADARGSERLLLSTRFALGAGFGGLLAIMALTGTYGIRVLQKIRRNENQIRRQFLLQNHALNEIRSQLYLSGTYVRDYLLEPESGRAETYRTSLEEVHRQMESGLESFGRQLEPEQTKNYGELSAELSNYWQILGPIFKWDSSQRRRGG
jgi:CHASE3 domain sensor protein